MDGQDRKSSLKVGFLPVSDCAPLVYAREAGLFDEYEVDVELRRETSWACIRDKVIYGELDAAHAPATLPFLANLGLESDPCACVSGLVLSLQGNAITVSRALWEKGVRDAETLRDRVYLDWGKRTCTFGVAFPISTAYLLLRQWLLSAGIMPEVEVRVITVAPAEMFPMLKLGYLDGCCVGEPWSTVAVQAGAGVCVATSADLAPLHPKSVLMVRQAFAAERADEHERLLAALLEACAYCDRPENRLLLSELLAHPGYVNAPVECLKPGFAGPWWPKEASLQSLSELTLFHRNNANEPGEDKAAWVLSHLYELLNQSPFRRPTYGRAPVLKNVFRRDIFERARAVLLHKLKQQGNKAATKLSRAV